MDEGAIINGQLIIKSEHFCITKLNKAKGNKINQPSLVMQKCRRWFL
jgi:hypothetical protein